MEQSLQAEDRLHRLEDRLEHLRFLYDQYFAGLSRVQPIKEADDFSREIRNFRVSDLVSTSQKFRFTNTKARYHQLRTHWEKICKQIEEGSFIREKALSRLKKSTAQEPKQKQTQENDIQALENLYETLQSTRKNHQALAKDKFMKTMKNQLQVFRKKNPGAAPQFRLAKDENGKTQVKIEKKASR